MQQLCEARADVTTAAARFLAGPSSAADPRLCVRWHPRDRLVSFHSLRLKAGVKGAGTALEQFEGRAGSAKGMRGSFLTPELRDAQVRRLR